MCGFLTLCRLHNTIPGYVETLFTKAGDNETKEGLRVEEATGEPGQYSALAT